MHTNIRKKLKQIFFAIAIFTLSALTPVHADLPQVMLEISGGSAAGDPRDFMLGYTFTVNTAFEIDGIGVWDEGSDGLSPSLQVGLWDGTGTLLRSATVTSSSDVELSPHGSGQWLFEDVEALTLTPGTWTIAYLRPASTELWRFATPSTIPNITYDNALELQTSSFQIPTQDTGTDGHFGPNLRVVGLDSAPVPTMSRGGVVLLAMMLLLVATGSGFYRRNRTS